jgi:phosphatidate cytidylyltransferase
VLKQRIITAVILASLFIGGVLYMPPQGVALLFAIMVLLAAWEWGALLGQGRGRALAYAGLVAAFLMAVWVLRGDAFFSYGLLFLAAIFWLINLVVLYRYNRNPSQRSSAARLATIGLIVLVPPWLALVLLHELPQFGAGYVLYLLVLIWVADSGAYFTGRAWGKRKLAPQVSPGKTLEGALGALAASAVLAPVGAWALDLSTAQWPGFIGLSLLIVIFSIAGDLFESMIKRQHNVKDSSQLLPGHGGVLDRVDSLTAAAPLFLLALLWTSA